MDKKLSKEQLQERIRRNGIKATVVGKLLNTAKKVLDNDVTASDQILYLFLLAIETVEQRAYLEGTLQTKVSTILDMEVHS